MCGICGLVFRDQTRRVESQTIATMCRQMVHRGPDDEGHYVSGAVGLGMRRLSIIDLAGGHQPLSNENENIHIVFNGEIYNYQYLQKDLLERGHRLSTNSDTETIVHLYEELGTDCFSRLRGMFAVALWDEERKNLILGLDRFGIKPLFYSETPDGILFASELKCILSTGLISLELDYEALAHYFTLGYIPAPYTAFRAVRKLTPGVWMRWSPTGKMDIQQYWDLPLSTRTYPSNGDLHRDLRDALSDAVCAHLVSDVPVGAFLSGGMDSSTVVALMAEATAAPIKTFSIGFSDIEHNELHLARQVAARYNTEHHELIVEPDAVDILPKLVSHFGEPFADSSALPTYYVSKMARDHVKVALSGDGGDELFLGYTLFRGLEVARYGQMLPSTLRRAIASFTHAVPAYFPGKLNERLLRFRKHVADSFLSPDDAYRSKVTMIGLDRVGSVLSDDFRSSLFASNPYHAINVHLDAYRNRTSHPLTPYIYNRIKVSLANDMLVKVDRMSMANSLEVRVPLLDHVLAEFIARIPVKQRFPRWRLKGLMRDVMADSLPADIIRQPKHGFTVPLASWFRGDLTEFAKGVLLDRDANSTAFWNKAEIEQLFSQHQERRDNVGSVLWSLLMFELWRQSVLG